MVCKNCNHEIDNGAMFCTYCGTPVEQTPEPETQPVENASTEDAAQNPYENVQTAQPEVDNADCRQSATAESVFSAVRSAKSNLLSATAA